MDYLIIITASFAVSMLTLFSGFGLGTVLMPVFALFLPIPTAIAATALVHLANNVFKAGLLMLMADWRVVFQFGLPAAIAAVVGAGFLVWFSGMSPLASYELFGNVRHIYPLKIVIGCLILFFAILEFSPAINSLSIPSKYIPLGGLLSGFFGGLSGNQGALRSAFLMKCGLDKNAFIATGAIAAVIVDTVRLAVYGTSQWTQHFSVLTQEISGLVIAATLASFLGAYLGSHLLKKVTLRIVKLIVAMGMLCIGALLVAGVI